MSDTYEWYFIECYFIARAKAKGVYLEDGTMFVKPGQEVWLGWDRDNGSPQLYLRKEWAHQFKDPEKIKKQLNTWHGMPWYYQMVPGSLEIFKVIERHERQEVLLEEEANGRVGEDHLDGPGGLDQACGLEDSAQGDR